MAAANEDVNNLAEIELEQHCSVLVAEVSDLGSGDGVC